MKPAVGGMPVRDSSATASAAASHGVRRPMPAKLEMASLLVRSAMAMTAKKAARLVTA